MNITHVPFCFYPDPVGGTEIYVESLARRLLNCGVRSSIAAPGDVNSAYDFNGLRVRRFAVRDDITDISDLYGGGDRLAAMEFNKILDNDQPDVVHLHAFTRGASLRLIREANRRGIRTVFTYHTPTVSCQRGTLMRWGAEICDGVLDTHRCAACTVHGLGVNETLARCLGSLPLSLSSLPGKFGLRGGAWTALRMAELMELRIASFRALVEEVDHLVALCQWSKDLLVRNGVPADKITISRHGIYPRSEISGQRSEVGGQLRLAFLGRLDRTKGADNLIQALRSLPDAPVELDLYGVIQSASGVAYLAALKSLAEGDRRIRFLPTVPAGQIVPLLRSYHLLAVPSQLLETGPLVVLEAFAAGIPVMGSNLGGIAELVRHEVDGLLVEAGSIAAWGNAIRRVCDDRAMLDRLCLGIQAPRTMDAVAGDMLRLYRGDGQTTERDRNDMSRREITHAFL